MHQDVALQDARESFQSQIAAWRRRIFTALLCKCVRLPLGLVLASPSKGPLEDRFALYQKAGKARLARHRLLTEYLERLTPEEFGA